MDLHEQFVHFHHGSTLIGTACFLMSKSPHGEECVGWAYSFPSRKDVATKSRGRAIAAGRARKYLTSAEYVPFNLLGIINHLPDLVVRNSRRGVNQDQLNEKIGNIRRWFFPQPQ